VEDHTVEFELVDLTLVETDEAFTDAFKQDSQLCLMIGTDQLLCPTSAFSSETPGVASPSQGPDDIPARLRESKR
jgi:hypothetical protein